MERSGAEAGWALPDGDRHHPPLKRRDGDARRSVWHRWLSGYAFGKSGVVAHLETWVGPEPDAYVFTGMKGGLVRPAVLQTAWNKARIAVDRTDLHFHDLRHTGNTLAAAVPGTSTKDLMARMGQSSSRAALLYQHASSDRDAVIAAALSKLARPAKVTPIGAKRTRKGARRGHGGS